MTELANDDDDSVEKDTSHTEPCIGRPKAAYPHVYATHWDTWFAQFRHKGQRHYLGTFDTAEEAHVAVTQAKDALA